MFFLGGWLQFICPSVRRMVCCLLKWFCRFWCSSDELLYYDVYFLDQDERSRYCMTFDLLLYVSEFRVFCDL